MANIKITGYAELNATPDDADLLEIVDDVAGTPTSKKITVANLKAAAAAKGANADITSMTALTQITRAVEIWHATNAELGIHTNRANVGDLASVIFSTIPHATGYRKGAIFYQSDDTSYGRGDMLFALAYGTGSENVTISDAKMVLLREGYLGIATTVPANPLAVNRSADGIIVDFESADVVEGNVSIAGNTTSYNAFVGSHYTQLKLGQKELPVGAVIISIGEIIPCEANIPEITEIKTEILEKDAFETVETEIDLITEKIVDGKLQKVKTKIGEEFKEYRIVGDKVVKIMKPIYEKITIQKTQLKKDHELDAKIGKIYKKTRTEQIISKNVSGKEYFTYIDTTTKSADKAVYGVWLGKMSDDAKGMSFGKDDKPVYLIAQVGLFKVRVTDTQGDIEIGDFLETSSRSMEAQKQVSKQKESGTIAKAMINVEWSKVTVDSELGYKWKLIPAVF